MRRLGLPLVCCLVLIGASSAAVAGQFEQIEKDLNNRAWFQKIADEACWRDLVLSVWGRAWLYLDATEVPQLGINDDFLMELVLDPTLLGEIELLRDKAGCSP